MPFIITEDPSHADAMMRTMTERYGSQISVNAISDDELAGMPLIDEMLRTTTLISRFIGEDLNGRSSKEIHFGCVPVYGDGSAPQLMSATSQDGTNYLVALIDLRYVFECLCHIYASPLGRYDPSAELSTALEKLALATRIAASDEKEIAHLALGLTSDAQPALYRDVTSEHDALLSRLQEASFLSDMQVSRVIQTVVGLQIFHEYGHHVCRHYTDQRTALEDNLSAFIKLHLTKPELQDYHDQENLTLAQNLLGHEEFDLVLNRKTSAEEFGRILEARLLARQDKEELLCDNFSVQNTAKFLVEQSNLGSGDWVLIRYVTEYMLTLSGRIASSLEVFRVACGAWNEMARQGADETKRAEYTNQLLVSLAGRKEQILVQSFRQKYALEQFDAAMAMLLHQTLKSGIDIQAAIDRYEPSASAARIMHAFSARHTNMIDRSLFTTDGLGGCSSKGRALQQLVHANMEAPNRQICDVFAFYVLGEGYHFHRA
ncbi:MAG: hypothetical protein AAFR65_04765 [Pseudomonadota bacterium]